MPTTSRLGVVPASSASDASATPTPPPPAGSRTSPSFSRLPRTAQVLLIWACASALTALLARLGAQDTPATYWGPAAPSWSTHVTFWDSGWYQRILEEGYPTQLPLDESGNVAQSTWAFMPLLPVLAGLLTWTGMSFTASATVVSLASSATAAVLTDRWLAPRVGARTSLWAVVLAWSGPCALVLQIPYAESLALALATGALLAVSRRRFLLAAPLVALAAIARPVGLPLAVGFGLWWLWETASDRGWRWVPARVGAVSAEVVRDTDVPTPLAAQERLQLAVLTAWSLACALAWPALAWATTGRMDAYTATETAWRGSHLAPFQPWFTRAGWWVGDHLGWALLMAMLALTALALGSRALRALGPEAWTWCLGYVLYLLAFFDPTTSLFRLLLPLTPLAWALASACTKRGRLALACACLAGQALWISWVWDYSSISILWVP
ncbi:hypothetical protein [Actinomyces urogenitalis]|uniref:hypothetical protein n=1 Tax=Actinomyces urogenitalis TaxID=103621 RepID=UPI00290E8A15|nr:hypothetical protein [Actinomyces urogenitalis]MDU5427791.1 hypothetical protein [Actinomyces urogenitalis]